MEKLDISVLWSMTPQTLIFLVIIISIEVLGVVQAIKGKWIFSKMSSVVLCFLFCFIASFMQSHYVSSVISSIFNLVFCSFSISTLAAQSMIGIIKKVPNIFLKAVEAKVGTTADEII
jgi:hypothetical protein